MIRAGIIQPMLSDDKKANLSKLGQAIEELARKEAKLIVLPELHNTRYFCQTENVDNFNLAETIPGESTKFFSSIAKRLGVVLVTSLFEKYMAGLYYNTSVVIDSNGDIAGIYRKMHIPDDPGYYEKFYFTPGNTGFKPVNTSIGKLGVQVCWDQWYPEGARLMALRGAQILIYPTAIGYSDTDDADEIKRQMDAWLTVQRGHAIANCLHVVTVNRTGFEPDPSGATSGIHFWGNSFVCGPQGEMLMRAPQDDEAFLTVDIDLDRTEQVRRWWPFLRDRRIDEFGGLTQRVINDDSI